MMEATSAVRWLALVAIVVIGGCAPGYHSYSGCYVDCKYCVPPPLPYVHYDGCVCHSCAATQYANTTGETGGSSNEFKSFALSLSPDD